MYDAVRNLHLGLLTRNELLANTVIRRITEKLLHTIQLKVMNLLGSPSYLRSVVEEAKIKMRDELMLDAADKQSMQ